MATKGFWSGATIQIVPVKNEEVPMLMIWTGSGGHLYEIEDLLEGGRLSRILEDSAEEHRQRYLTWLEVWGDIEEERIEPL